MKRATLNYVVDMATGIAFLLSSVSGLVFLLPGEPASSLLGASYSLWNDLHTFSSLTMIVGVGLHLVLHWNWLVGMTKRTISRNVLHPVQRSDACVRRARTGLRNTADVGMSRRMFLGLASSAVIGACLLAIGRKVVPDASTTLEETQGVACPFGLVNDSYPGRCRRYRDSDGDHICDFSLLGSGNNVPRA